MRDNSVKERVAGMIRRDREEDERVKLVKLGYRLAEWKLKAREYATNEEIEAEAMRQLGLMH